MNNIAFKPGDIVTLDGAITGDKPMPVLCLSSQTDSAVYSFIPLQANSLNCRAGYCVALSDISDQRKLFADAGNYFTLKSEDLNSHSISRTGSVSKTDLKDVMQSILHLHKDSFIFSEWKKDNRGFENKCRHSPGLMKDTVIAAKRISHSFDGDKQKEFCRSTMKLSREFER